MYYKLFNKNEIYIIFTNLKNCIYHKNSKILIKINTKIKNFS